MDIGIDHKLSRFVIGLAAVTGLLLLVPLIAMQFSNEVVWTLSDFVFAGTLLFGTGLTYKLIARKSDKTAYRVAVGFALFTGFLLIWLNLAVGLVGSESNPFNLIYMGVIAVGISRAVLACFKPGDLTSTMFSMALAMVIAAILALSTGQQYSTGSSVIEILGVNGLFVMLFSVSAFLFLYAGEE